MKLLLGFLFAATIQTAMAQEKVIVEREEGEVKIVDFAPVEPSFVGGEEAMMKFIQTNIKYPSSAIAQSLQGIVYVQFVVRTDGSLTDIKIIRGVHASLDDEAKRVIALMPNWTPGGLDDGTKVNVRYTLPIHFRLSDDPTLEQPVIKRTEKEMKADKKAAKKAEKKK